MQITEKQLAEKFAAFEKEQDPTLLHEALDMLEATERNLPVDDPVARQLAISHRLRFLALLDRTIDPTWSSTNLPVGGVTPPGPHGVVYPSGEVDPSTIPDATARAEYERALKAARESAKRFGVQLQLQRIEERFMLFVRRLLLDRYTESAADQAEYAELLAASSLSDARKEELRALHKGSG